MRTDLIRLSGWVCLVSFGLSAPVSVAHAAELGIDEAVGLALEQNPDVRFARAELEVAMAGQTGASLLLLDNPQLSVSAGQRSRPGEQTPNYAISIAQPIEIAGQRRARMDVADATLRAAEARLMARRVEIVAAVRRAFGRALAAQAELKVAEEGVVLAKQALEAAQARHRAGDSSLIEVNTARIESGRASRQPIAASQQVLMAMAEVKLLLGMAVHEELRLRGSIEALSTRAAPRPDVLDRARRQRPDLLAARAELEAAEAALSLAERKAFPTPQVGVSYGGEERAQLFLGTLSVDLPFFNRNQAQRGVARARASQSRITLESLERRVAQEVELALARRQAAQAAVDAVNGDVLRAAESNLELASEGYRAGQLDFLQLLLIRRETLDIRRGRIEVLEELNRADALLDQVLGTVPKEPRASQTPSIEREGPQP